MRKTVADNVQFSNEIAASVIASVQEYIQAHPQTVRLLSYEKLYDLLDEKERELCKAIRALTPPGIEGPIKADNAEASTDNLERVSPSLCLESPSDPSSLFQYLPHNAHSSFVSMTESCEEEIGEALVLLSGYRSLAYQLYIFLMALRNAKWNIDETLETVMLPAYSEHSDPKHTAVDISIRGHSEENDPLWFAETDAFAWLSENADTFGFTLSFPKNNSTVVSFEPWHWRYVD